MELAQLDASEAARRTQGANQDACTLMEPMGQ
jgi:hypothetical protein